MNILKLLDWEYLGGERIVLNDTSQQATAARMADATIVHIAAAGGDVYYDINGVAAAVTSPGFVAENTRLILGPLRDFNAIAFFGGAGVNVHVEYYRENKGK